jgi:hypothetical protein
MGDERDPLTDDALEQMERRSQAASKPPWKSFIEGRDHSRTQTSQMYGLGGLRVSTARPGPSRGY